MVLVVASCDVKSLILSIFPMMRVLFTTFLEFLNGGEA